MSEWNSAFSGAWTKNIGDSPVTTFFVFGSYNIDSLSNLPNINFRNSNTNIQSNVKNRIAEILQTGFVDNETYVKVDPPGALEFNGEEASNFYIVCFGIHPFYNQNPMDPVSKGRYPNSVSFVPGEDLKSTNNLQLLPVNKKIVVYSYSGQMSAFVVAYLRVLGYDARSLLYGGNMLFYSFMTAKIDAFTPFVFLAGDVKNYSYITGTSSK
jgi:rhodanese-related sulfurtransferase